MPDPLTLIVAKAKAVGLVAGTAMVVTLAGGGAVALTAVSNEGDLPGETVQVDASPSPDAGLVTTTVSDTPTVGIESPAPEADGDEKVRPPLPADFTCDESKNHGQNVSAYAKSLPKGPGRGEKISAVAQSDCGKGAGDEAETEQAETETAETETEDPAKAAAKAERKAERDAAKAERKSGRDAAKADRSAAKTDRKSGKGGGKK